MDRKLSGFIAYLVHLLTKMPYQESWITDSTSLILFRLAKDETAGAALRAIREIVFLFVAVAEEVVGTEGKVVVVLEDFLVGDECVGIGKLVPAGAIAFLLVALVEVDLFELEEFVGGDLIDGAVVLGIVVHGVFSFVMYGCRSLSCSLFVFYRSEATVLSRSPA